MMNKTFEPNERYFTVPWTDLEHAWKMLASPQKLPQIRQAIETMQMLDRCGNSEKAAFDMVAATAWLTDDGPCSKDGWRP